MCRHCCSLVFLDSEMLKTVCDKPPARSPGLYPTCLLDGGMSHTSGYFEGHLETFPALFVATKSVFMMIF